MFPLAKNVLSNDQLVKLEGKRALLRLDFNIDVQGQLSFSHLRFQQAIRLIKKLLKANLEVVIIAHRGRPHGKANPRLSLIPIKKKLEEVLNKEIGFVSASPKSILQFLKRKSFNEITMIENIRFLELEFQIELKNGKIRQSHDAKVFFKELSLQFDAYINNSFSASHRVHNSIAGIRTPQRFVGEDFFNELVFFKNLVRKNKSKKALILGGGKIFSTLLENPKILSSFDSIFFGIDFYNSSISHPDELLKIKRLAKKLGCKICSPIDTINLPNKLKASNQLLQAGDIGQETIHKYIEDLNNFSIIFWNGPLGFYEDKTLENGTRSITHFFNSTTRDGIVTVAGGGSTLDAIDKYGNFSSFSHISTGGSAMISYFINNSFPTISQKGFIQ